MVDLLFIQIDTPTLERGDFYTFFQPLFANAIVLTARFIALKVVNQLVDEVSFDF